MQLLPGELLVRRVPLVPRLLVQPLGERLGEPVGERAHHDRAVVVELGREAVRELLRPVDRDGERAHVVGEPGLRRRDEVGERAVRPRVVVRGLLPEHREAEPPSSDDDRRSSARRRPEAVDAAGLQRPVGDDLVEQLVRRREELPRRLALLGVVEDRRESAP